MGSAAWESQDWWPTWQGVVRTLQWDPHGTRDNRQGLVWSIDDAEGGGCRFPAPQCWPSQCAGLDDPRLISGVQGKARSSACHSISHVYMLWPEHPESTQVPLKGASTVW